jgi:hypothetical protein
VRLDTIESQLLQVHPRALCEITASSSGVFRKNVCTRYHVIVRSESNTTYKMLAKASQGRPDRHEYVKDVESQTRVPAACPGCRLLAAIAGTRAAAMNETDKSVKRINSVMKSPGTLRHP